MKDIVLSTTLIVLLILVVNPTHFWMPSSAHMGMLAALVAVCGLLAVYVLQELAVDERETQHRAFAGRMAFLIGAGVLLSGIVSQGLNGEVDVWLGLALGAMVLAKISSRVYSDRCC